MHIDSLTRSRVEKCLVSVHDLAASEDFQVICIVGNLRNSEISQAAACFVLILAGRELFYFSCGTGNFLSLLSVC